MTVDACQCPGTTFGDATYIMAKAPELYDPAFAKLLAAVTATGRHHNPTANPDYFTTSFFHLPDELDSEMRDAGLADIAVLAVEGIGWVGEDLDERMARDDDQQKLLDLLQRLEREPSILGASPHLLGVGFVPE